MPKPRWDDFMIKGRVLIAALALCGATFSEAQLFQRYWNNRSLIGPPGTVESYFRDVISLPNGQFLAVGATNVSGVKYGLMCFYSRSGSIVRTLTYSGSLSGMDFHEAAVTPDNNIALVGLTGTPSQPYVMKTDLAGNSLWVYQGGVAGDTKYHTNPKLKVHTDGSVYIAGIAQNEGPDYDPFVMKYSNSGSLVGGLKFETPALLPVTDTIGDLAIGNTGHAYVCGKTSDKAYLWKVSPDVTNTYFQQFQLTTGQTTNLSCLLPLSDGSLIGAGDSTPSNRLYLAKWSSAGVRSAPVYEDSVGYGNFTKIFQDTAGNVLLSGFAYVASSENIVVAKYNTDLARQWVSNYNSGGTRNERSIDATIDAFGEIYTLSYSQPGFSAEPDCLLTKHSGAGGLRFAHRYQANPTGFAYLSGIALHKSSGDLMIVGERPSFANTFCIGAIYRQAPLAVIDGFVIKRNTVYVSPRTLTTNDRQWQGATVSLDSGVSNGTLELRSNGTFTYTPNSGFTGIDSFFYQLTKPGLTTSKAKVTLQVVP